MPRIRNYFKGKRGKIARLMDETLPAAFPYYLDSFRRQFTCGPEIAAPGCRPVHFENPVAENLMYRSGNFPEGYFYPAMINNAISWLFPSMPERRRTAASIALSTAIISYAERKDPWDIPAALIGSLAYLGIRRLAASGRGLYTSYLNAINSYPRYVKPSAHSRPPEMP